VEQIFVAPGNAGTAGIATNIDVGPTDIDSLAKTAREKGVDFTVVGPEAPLAAGIVDEFQARGLPIFGPSRAAAQIEASKVFAKELMHKYNIPCAASATFTSYNEARDYLLQQPLPVVIKADGLAAGKGVTVATTTEQGIAALTNIMQEKVFGAAGDRVLVEECLVGREMSYFVFTDGQHILPTVPACDYKPVFDNNQGPNTGGMGSYSPPFFATPELEQAIFDSIMRPTIEALAAEGCPYRGVLYGGLMITADGPKVMEFNARLGDPETQVVLPRLQTDLADIILGVINGNLDQVDIQWSDDACVGVVLASGGYPGSYKKGLPITGFGDLDEEITVFHAGTALNDKGEVVTSGGRVLTLVASGETIAKARQKVYNNISRLKFEGCHYRSDIALITQA
jgi:phosphoribosylamine--glycine ligase